MQAKLFDAASSFGWGPNRTRITSAVPTVTLFVRSTRLLPARFLPDRLPFFFRRVFERGEDRSRRVQTCGVSWQLGSASFGPCISELRVAPIIRRSQEYL